MSGSMDCRRSTCITRWQLHAINKYLRIFNPFLCLLKAEQRGSVEETILLQLPICFESLLNTEHAASWLKHHGWGLMQLSSLP